jgi:hypothetical protein
MAKTMTTESITFANEPDEHHTHSAWITGMFGRRRVWTTPEMAAEMRHGVRSHASCKAAATRKAHTALKDYEAGKGTAEAAIEAISSRSLDCNSHERLMVMLRIAGLGWAPREIFWPVFCSHWSHCDATWWHQELLIYILRKKAPAILSDDEQKVFDALPDPVRVYRGCSRERIKGVSLTTERRIAEGFARGHRMIPVPDPVIASAMIAKGDIFITNSDRNEDEVLLDPDRLQELSVKHARSRRVETVTAMKGEL